MIINDAHVIIMLNKTACGCKKALPSKVESVL